MLFCFLILESSILLFLQILPQDLLKKYLTYAKLNVFPRLHDADLDKLTHVYAELRRESSVSSLLMKFDNSFSCLLMILWYIPPFHLAHLAWTRSAHSSEAHRIHDTNVWSTCQNAPQTACHTGRCRHGHSCPAWFIHFNPKVWGTESTAKGIERDPLPLFSNNCYSFLVAAGPVLPDATYTSINILYCSTNSLCHLVIGSIICLAFHSILFITCL